VARLCVIGGSGFIGMRLCQRFVRSENSEIWSRTSNSCFYESSGYSREALADKLKDELVRVDL